MATWSAAPTEDCASASNRCGSPAIAEAPRWLAKIEAKTLPTTATPRVPPASRVASLIADPTPAFAAGSTDRIESVAGTWVRPMPRPMSTICPTMTGRSRPRGDTAIQAKDAPSSASPDMTTARVPEPGDQRPARASAPTAIDPATGRIRTPVDSGP